MLNGITTGVLEGQICVFVPLQSDTIRDLEQKGVKLEECFSLDFSANGGSTLRVMKNRENIVPYSPGLCCFMDLDSMRELFGQEGDYCNVVYSDHALDIAPGRLCAVSTKADVKKSADVFVNMMHSMIVKMITAAVLMFLIVLYQMMKVMIDRSATSISLMKIFGYRSREIRKLYLDENFLLVAVGALLMIPAAKFLMDAAYPYFIANVACR